MGADRTATKSFFDWIKPSMAADGLLVPAPWQDEHAALAAAEFTDPRLQKAAVILAVLHPHVLDYIAQAPVLVLAAAGGHGDLGYRSERLKLATSFISAAGASHRLPHIMRAYGLVPPLRRLAGTPLSFAHHRLLKPLAAIPEVSLAQIIPASGTDQRGWLASLTRLSGRRWTSPQQRDRFVGWAALHLRTPQLLAAADDLADWAMLDGRRFDPAMSLEQVQTASRRWHDEQASVRLRRTYSAHDLAIVADYGPLPAVTEMGGLELHALRTLAELDMESQRMHHCVRSYWHFVTAGRSLIFSIRQGAARIATLELQPDLRKRSAPRPLVMAQIKGPCNVRPAEPVIACARQFVELANARIAEAAKQAKAKADAPAE